MAEAKVLNPISGKNATESCEILKDLIHGSGCLFNSEGVKDVRRKVQDRDDYIEEYHKELTRLWQSVHNHNLKKSAGGERDDSDYDEDDENHELEFERHKENLKEINERIKRAKREVKSGMSSLRKDHQNAVFCPLAESSWHHPNYPSSPLSFKHMKIKLSHGSEIVPFQEGSEEYVKIYFEKESTYRIPVPSKKEQRREIGKDDKRQLSHIPDEEIPETHQKIISDRKGEVATDIVARCFEKWGIENKKNIMIFTDLRLPNQRFHCPENFVCTNGDFDVLILSDEFVLFCQVKGVDEGTHRSTKGSKLHDAWQQSIKDRRHFCEATRDLSFISSLPMHRVIAVPNLTSGTLKGLGMCSYHRRFTLCKSDMTPFSQFGHWISDIVNSRDNAAHVSIPRENYRTLRARFVGVVSKVRLNTDQVSIQATDNVINPKHYVKKVDQNLQCRLYAILTPEQAKIIQDDRRKLIITGDFGTGKSLVLLTKVLNLLEDKENPSVPLIISLASIGNDGHCYHRTKFHAVNHLKEIIDLPTEKQKSIVLSISDLIKDYCRAIGKPIGEAVKTLITPELFYGMLSWKVKTTGGVVHFFFDEVPLSFLQRCESVLREFPTNFPGSHVWLAIAAHSSKIAQISHEGYEATINILGGTFPSDPQLTGNSYVVERLNRSMRVPRNVYNFVRFMQENEYPKSNRPTTSCGHVVVGPKPLFLEVPKCICQYAKARSEDILKCHCSVRRLSVTLERVMSKCHLIDSESPIDPSKCNILINVLLGSKLAKPLIKLLKAACDILKVRLSFNLVVLLDEQSQAAQDGEDGEGLTLNVFDQYTFMGCENAVIIGIDPYSLFQCGENTIWTRSMNVFTRTTSLYVHVYWPNGEALKMWHGDLDAYDDLTAKRQYLTEDEKKDRLEFTKRGRASRGDLVEKLIQTDCIIKIPVSMDENSNRIADSTQSINFLQ